MVVLTPHVTELRRGSPHQGVTSTGDGADASRMPVRAVTPLAPQHIPASDPRPRASLTLIEGTPDPMDQLQTSLATANAAVARARTSHREARSTLAGLAVRIGETAEAAEKVADQLRAPRRRRRAA